MHDLRHDVMELFAEAQHAFRGHETSAWSLAGGEDGQALLSLRLCCSSCGFWDHDDAHCSKHNRAAERSRRILVRIRRLRSGLRPGNWGRLWRTAAERIGLDWRAEVQRNEAAQRAKYEAATRSRRKPYKAAWEARRASEEILERLRKGERPKKWGKRWRAAAEKLGIDWQREKEAA